jgi:Na+/proline symporter
LSFCHCFIPYIGGVKAVIWTDAVQFALFLLGGVFAFCYIPILLGDLGISGVFSQSIRRRETALVKYHSPPWRFMGSILIGRPVQSSGWALSVAQSWCCPLIGAEQLIVQRVLACKDVADGRRALVLSAVLIFPLILIFLLVGAMLWVFYQNHPFQISITEPRPGSGIQSQRFHFSHLYDDRGATYTEMAFLIVAILAAAMSSVSSALTSLSSVSTMDFIKHFIRDRSEDFLPPIQQGLDRCMGRRIDPVAYLSRQVEFVLNAAFSLRGLTSGALLGGLLLAVFWKNGRTLPVIVGMLISLVVMIVVQFFPKWSTTKDFWNKTVGIEIFWPWYTLIGALVTLGTAWTIQKFLPVLVRIECEISLIRNMYQEVTRTMVLLYF